MYKGLSLDVIRFEAQDVVTASILTDNGSLNNGPVTSVTPASCICRNYTGDLWWHVDDNGNPCQAASHRHDGVCK